MTRTSHGAPLTNEVLEQLADDAEAGYAPHQLRVRKGPGRPRLSDGEGPSRSLNVRIGDELRDRLSARAEREGTTTSDLVREALWRYLAS